jgi:integrase
VPVDSSLAGRGAVLPSFARRRGNRESAHRGRRLPTVTVAALRPWPYSPAVLSRYWRDAVQAAGIRHIKLHAARHTCATLMHLQGVPVAVIAAWIGHKDASTTMKIYAHSQNDALKAAGASLNRVVTSRDTGPR